MAALDRIGGLPALGSARTDNMYHAGWAWAGGTPFKGTKLLAAYFGGTRNPMVVSWPGHIKHDGKMRQQFHHVIDIAPTIYDILDIPEPKVVNGYEQINMDGVSLAYTFDDASAKPEKHMQFFDNNGSRGIYLDGWFAGTAGPFIPWDTPGSAKRLAGWDSAKDQWELYDLRSDFSQAHDLAKENPEKLEQMKKQFLEVAQENKDFPIGAGNWLRLHPEDRVKTVYNDWTFGPNTRRMPEFAAPGVGRQSTHVTIDAEFGENANGVLYAVGGAGGGLSVYLDNGQLVYEYNMMIIENYKARTEKNLSRQAPDRRRHEDRQAGRSGRSGDHHRRRRSCAHDRAADRARRLHGDRVIRCRGRSWLDGFALLRGAEAIRIRWQDRGSQGCAIARVLGLENAEDRLP